MRFFQMTEQFAVGSFSVGSRQFANVLPTENCLLPTAYSSVFKIKEETNEATIPIKNTVNPITIN